MGSQPVAAQQLHGCSKGDNRHLFTTENVTRTVPVQPEEVRVEREPTDANRDVARDGPAISEEEHEVILDESGSRG
jgi:hypothetical protein